MTTELGINASENLLETYFALGASSPAATLRREENYRICLSQANHPISNFAADLRLDANAAARLASIAASRPNFHVYRLPSDRPRHAAELLYQAGFRVGHTLQQMAWESGTPPTGTAPPVELRPAETLRERERIASFMTEQFFAKQPVGFRRQVMEGTSRATKLELCEVLERGRPIGAVMLCETEDTLGIYNLCVSANARNRGWGREIMRSLKHQSVQRHKLLVLQCEASLVGWYRNQDFNSVGFVEVFSYSAGTSLDIM